MNKLFFLIAGLLIFASPVYAIFFLPGVGAKPSKADRADYVKRASNYDGEVFHNEDDFPLMLSKAVSDENTISHKGTRPKNLLPVEKPSYAATPSKDDLTVTWFGHSSLLIQMGGKNILIDPVLSKRLSPVTWIGPSRFTPSPVSVEELPRIDLLILSHDHYDHLDYQVIKRISRKVDKVIVPLGVECHLRKWKFDMSKVENMAWWEEIQLDGLLVGCTPAQHFSGRWLSGRNRTLWASWVLKTADTQIFYNGDSGFGTHFSAIHEKYGDFDLALMECGQYNTKWAKVHSFPEEGSDAMKTVGAKLAMPVHWGAFVLSTHGWDDSVERFTRHAESIALPYITPQIGQTVNLKSDLSPHQEKWWRDLQ